MNRIQPGTPQSNPGHRGRREKDRASRPGLLWWLSNYSESSSRASHNLPAPPSIWPQILSKGPPFHRLARFPPRHLSNWAPRRSHMKADGIKGHEEHHCNPHLNLGNMSLSSHLSLYRPYILATSVVLYARARPSRAGTLLLLLYKKCVHCCRFKAGHHFPKLCPESRSNVRASNSLNFLCTLSTSWEDWKSCTVQYSAGRRQEYCRRDACLPSPHH